MKACIIYAVAWISTPDVFAFFSNSIKNTRLVPAHSSAKDRFNPPSQFSSAETENGFAFEVEVNDIVVVCYLE